MKLLITGAWNYSREQVARLRELGHNLIFQQQEKDALVCDASDVEGVICNGLFLYHDIKEFKKLKYIQLTSAGYDRVPLDYIDAKKIKIFNARGVYSKPMAEFVVSGVLQLYKQSRFFYENQKFKKWVKHRELLELCDKTILVVGCGSVGTECAKRFKAFDCNVIGVDLIPYESEYFSEMSGINGLDNKLSRADVVVLTLPLTEKTKGLFNADRFEKMKNGAVLVNIARGAIVDESALLRALDEKLFGAVLDVFEEEPLNEKSGLWDKANVIITPHNSFVGDKDSIRLYNLITQNLSIVNRG